jgi:hypothetical protein
MPLVNLRRSEATVHETYILRTNPNARVAVPYQNDVSDATISMAYVLGSALHRDERIERRPPRR